MRTALALVSIAAAAVLVCLSLSDMATATDALETPPPPTTPPTTALPAPAEVGARRALYTLDYSRALRIAARDVEPQVARGTWAVEPADRPGIEQVRFVAEHVAGPGELPDAALIEAPFQVRRVDGRLSGLALDPALDPAGHDLLTTLATAFQYSPGSGATWTAVEEDVNGRYEATYTRQPSGDVLRTRVYLAMRTPTGWNPRQAEAMQVEGATRFELDADGLRVAEVDEAVTLRMDGQTDAIVARISGRLVRVDVERIGRPVAAARGFEAPQSTAGRLTRGQRDAELLVGHDVDSLLADFAALRDLPDRGPEAGRWRGTQLLRLRALARQHPEAIGALIEDFVAHADGDPRRLSLLAQGLSEADTPAARDGLLDLMGRDLPPEARRRAALGLGMLDHPSAETAAALTAALDEPELGSTPALGLGNTVRNLDGAGEAADEAAGDAIEALLTRYATAGSRAEKRLYLQALANSGDLRALPVMVDALGGGDPVLAELAAFGLRFMPGPEVDALLAGLLAGPALTRVRVAAVKAIAMRDPAVWHPLLEAARERVEIAEVRAAIERVLGRG